MSLHLSVRNDQIPFEMKLQIPNAQTKVALDEYEEMRKNPEAYKHYSSFDEVLTDVFADASFLRAALGGCSFYLLRYPCIF